VSVRRSNSHRRRRTRRASPKVTLVEKFARTYRHVPFRSRVAVAAALVFLGCIVVLAVSLELGFHSWQFVATSERTAAPFWPPSSILLPTGHSRTVYPYSVIAGGAQSPQELREAVAADPVVARHYADFDITNARRVMLDTPKLAYVSYRIGNKVFWTKHKLALRKGEAMLSDGTNMARTRCGNRISVLPVRPNAPAEPTSSELEGPEFPAIVSSPYLAAYSAPAPALFPGPIQSPGGPGAAFVPVAPFFPLPGGGGIIGNKNSSPPPPGGGGGTPGTGGGGTPGSGGGGGTTPPPSGGTPGGGGGGTTPPGGGTPGGGGGGITPPLVGVPEPGTAVLVLVGLGAAAMRARRKRKAC
jgi:PEP-CTERM motif